MTNKEAFIASFLDRCVRDGATPAQIEGRIKLAAGLLGTVAGKALDVGKGIGEAAINWGLPIAGLAPPILGGAAGYGLARATDIDDTDVDDIKDREVLDEYKRQTRHLLRQRAVKDYQQARQQSGRMFG